MSTYAAILVLSPSFLIFLRIFHTVFYCSYTGLHSHQQCTSVPFPPHPHKHLFVDLVMMAILTGVKLYLIVVLICISLMASDAEHPFICLWRSMSSLEKCLFKSFAHFIIGIFLSSWSGVMQVLNIFWKSNLCPRYHLQICFSIRFILLRFSLPEQKLFIFMMSHLCIVSFMPLALGDISVKILLFGTSESSLPIFSSSTFMVS